MPVQRLRTEICSEFYSHCVYVTQAKSGIFNVSPAAFSLIVILTFVFSYTGVFAVSAYLGRRRSIEFRLKHAVHCNKIYMEYQPILSVKTGEISGIEGLIRWRDEVFGQVSPELFIPIATEIGLYPRMSMQAIESALRDLSPILQKNRQIVYALNVDEFEIQSENFFSNLRLLLEKYSVYPKQIKIEITERINLPICDLASFSKRAKDNGCEVALDDFGTGVANLVWLTEIDFDAIKIDRIFTQALNNDLKKQMVLPIISMINSLNKLVVFEGVENHEEAEIISQLGENYHMQGWYFYRPMGIQALRSLFE
jgi:sensor c-di-GMP phosphodiesterase-like protein